MLPRSHSYPLPCDINTFYDGRSTPSPEVIHVPTAKVHSNTSIRPYTQLFPIIGLGHTRDKFHDLLSIVRIISRETAVADSGEYRLFA